MRGTCESFTKFILFVFSNTNFHAIRTSSKMPTATSAKIGTKRKAEIGKDNYVKKPKVDGDKKSRGPEVKVKKVHVKAPKEKKAPKVVEPEPSSDDEFDGMSEDGGAALDEEEDDSESIPIPRAEDGIHPDRLKAATNGAGPNGALPTLHSLHEYF